MIAHRNPNFFFCFCLFCRRWLCVACWFESGRRGRHFRRWTRRTTETPDRRPRTRRPETRRRPTRSSRSSANRTRNAPRKKRKGGRRRRRNKKERNNSPSPKPSKFRHPSSPVEVRTSPSFSLPSLALLHTLCLSLQFLTPSSLLLLFFLLLSNRLKKKKRAQEGGEDSRIPHLCLLQVCSNPSRDQVQRFLSSFFALLSLFPLPLFLFLITLFFFLSGGIAVLTKQKDALRQLVDMETEYTSYLREIVEV